MNPAPPHRSPWRWLATLVVPLAWASVAAAMGASWSSDPYDPALTGTDAYGHNGEGGLSFGLMLTGIEALVLLFALRPWSYTARSWARPLVTLGAALPWTLLSALLTMHAGGIIVLHLLWLLAVDAALAVLTVAMALAAQVIISQMIGLLTPPVGTVIFVLQAIAKAKMAEVFWGSVPFLAPLMLLCLAIIFWPDAILYLPERLGL